MVRRTAGVLVVSLMAAAGLSLSTAAPAGADAGVTVPSGGCGRPQPDRLWCFFGFTGAPEQWTVPAGVTQMSIQARGAQGASLPDPSGTRGIGGRGLEATLTAAVTPGEVLTMTVGGRGHAPSSGLAGLGGFGGGGDGTRNSGGGGGATTVSDAAGRWIAAGGGGGAARGVDGGTPRPRPAGTFVGEGGAAATPFTAGAGGSATTCPDGVSSSFPGGAGSPGSGANGGDGGQGGSGADGAGGGGGWLGGGGGSAGAYCDQLVSGGGGGAGSSWFRETRPVQNFRGTSAVQTDDGVVAIEFAWPDPDGAPTVTIDQAAGQPDPTTGSSVLFDVVFDQPVTGFVGPDIDLSSSTAGGPLTALVSPGPQDDGMHYVATVTGMTTAGTVVASLPWGAATDDDFSYSAASTSTDNSVTWAPPDGTAPGITITTPASGATYLLNEVVPADYACTDEAGGSGVATCTGDAAVGSPIDTSTVKEHGFTVTTSDVAGNSGSSTVLYSVAYGFSGFGSPVDAGVTNTAKAGRVIPFKFSVTDGLGAPVTTLATVTAKAVQRPCGSTAGGTDAIEEYAAGGSGLQNLGGGAYQFNFATSKAWAGSCRTLGIDLGDGLARTADFSFSR